MRNWLKRQWQAFLAWQKDTDAANAEAGPHACCSSPPPGAGKQLSR